MTKIFLTSCRTLLFILPFCSLAAQSAKIDSLQLVVKTSEEDSNRVNALNGLAEEFRRSAPDSSLYFSQTAFQLAGKIDFAKGIAEAGLWMGNACASLGKNDDAIVHLQRSIALIDSVPALKNNVAGKKTLAACHHKLGSVLFFKGDFSSSLGQYSNAIRIRKEIGDKKGLADTYNNIGNVYKSQGNLPGALQEYFASLKLRELIGDQQGVAMSHNNIGIIYFNQENYSSALYEYFAAIKIQQQLKDIKGLAGSHSNIGSVYANQMKLDEAIEEYLLALSFFEQLGDKYSISHTRNNLGAAYAQLKRYDDALREHRIALDLRKQIDDQSGLSDSYYDIGFIYLQQGKTNEARSYILQSLEIAKSLGEKEMLRYGYQALAGCDSASLDYKNAFKNYKLYVAYRDSLINEDNSKKTMQTQLLYEFEKKEAIASAEHQKEIETQKKIADAENKKQRIIILSVCVGLLLAVVFAAIILRSLSITRKQNKLIEEQKNQVELSKKEIEQAKHIIEEKNKDITDSINYARRIQKAMLPHRRDIWSAFPQSFVLYKPKDIVSGDFYYFKQKEGLAFIAAGDCTGHGVPGAFMSLIGSNKLDEAVQQSNEPGQILSLLNTGIKIVLKQSEGEGSTRDGMDIALCGIDVQKRLVRYSGANRPLWLIRKNSTEVEEIKATKKAIGGFTEDEHLFNSHEIQLGEGDSLYLFTDGYADAFGGNGKKLMTKRFKELLIGMQSSSMKEQEKLLDDHIISWMGATEQMDDILVIGVRL